MSPNQKQDLFTITVDRMLLVFIVMAIGLLRMARDLNLYFIMQLIMI